MKTTSYSLAQFNAQLLSGAYAWPGGYPLYFITSDGAALSFGAAEKEAHLIRAAIEENDTRSGWHVCACDVNWEDADLICDHTGQRIESAYADVPSASDSDKS